MQLSGIVMSADSLHPVFYASVWNATDKRGELSNINGFFSVVAEPGDVIRFSAVGFRAAEYAIPTDIKGNMHSIVQFLERDTVQLPEVLIRPWPKPSQLKQAVLGLDLPQSELQQARENLDREKLREALNTLAMDGNENFDAQMRNIARASYTAGQYPQIQLLNPMAWAAFFKALARGDFKNKSKH